MAYLDTAALVQQALANNPQLQALLAQMGGAGGAQAAKPSPAAGKVAFDPVSAGPAPAPAAGPNADKVSGDAATKNAVIGKLFGGALPKAPTGPPSAAKPGDWTDATYANRYASGGGVEDPKTLQANAQTLPGLKLEDQSAAAGKFGAGYLAKTNMGDTTTSVNATDGARVQLIDPSNGQVVAEGTGPQGAQYIASLASQISQKLGKQANWDIATETGKGTGKFNTAEGDRTDKPRFTLLSALKQVATPLVAIAGTMMGIPPIELAALAGGTSLATGHNLTQSLLSAVGAGAGGYFGGAGGSAGSAAGAGGADFAGGIGNALSGLSTDAAGWGAAAAGLGDVGLSGFGAGLGSALAGTGFGSLAGGLAGGIGGAGNSAGGLANGGALPGAAVQGPNTVPELTVTGAKGAVGGGLGAGAGAGALAGLPNVVPELTVTGAKPPPPGPTIDPATIMSNVPGLIPSPSGGLDAKLDSPSNTGKEIKTATDLIKNLLGNGTSPAPTQTTGPGVTPMTPEGGGGKPGTGTTTSPSPIPGVTPAQTGTGLGTPGGASGSPKGPMAQVGAGAGGSSGVGAAGPGNLKLQGSLAPNIYPWMSSSGNGGEGPSDQGTQGL